jgi:hypothetical protein
MQIVLLKNYKPHTRELKEGTQLGVTNEVGLQLIAKGIAKESTEKEIVYVPKEAMKEEPIEAVEETTETKETTKERKNKNK